MKHAPIDLRTTEEAAKILKSNPRTLERWRVEGNGPPFAKIGRRVGYRLDDLEAWVAGRVRRHTGEAV